MQRSVVRKSKQKALMQETKGHVTGLKFLNKLQSEMQMSLLPYPRLDGFGVFVDISNELPTTELSVGQSKEAKRLGAVIYLADSYNGCHILAPSDVKRLKVDL